MPNVPINLPENEQCPSEGIDLPECLAEFLGSLSPVKFDQTGQSYQEAWNNLAQEVEAKTLALEGSLRDFKNNEELLNEISASFESLKYAFKCPADSDTCGSITNATAGLKASLNGIKAQIDTLLGNELLKDAAEVSKDLTNRFLALATFEGFDFDCPDEDALDPGLASERAALQNDSPQVPSKPKGLKQGPAADGAISLSWDNPRVPTSEKDIIYYQINVNGVRVAIVPYFMDNWVIRDLPSGQCFDIDIFAVNQDPVPLSSKPTSLVCIKPGTPFPVQAPRILKALPYNGGFYLSWERDDEIIDVDDFSETDYEAVVIDPDQFFIVAPNNYETITQVRNDATVVQTGSTLYDLTDAEIKLGTTYRISLDFTNSLNQSIGLDKTDDVRVNFSETESATFFSVGERITVTVNDPNLNVDQFLSEVNKLRRLRPVDGEFDTYDLVNLQILDQRSFQIDAPDTGDNAIDINIFADQPEVTEVADEIEVQLEHDSITETFSAILNTDDTSAPLVLSIPTYDLEFGTPILISVNNATKGFSYDLTSADLEIGRNFGFNNELSDQLEVDAKFTSKVSHINVETKLLTIIDPLFTNVSSILNETKQAFYNIDTAEFVKGSTLIKLDPSKPTNQTIGMRGDDLVTFRTEDYKTAQFLNDNFNSNFKRWKIELRNPILGSKGVFNNVTRVYNLDRPGQDYDLTNAVIKDRFITLLRSDGFNEQIGIDPRDRIRVEYDWLVFPEAVAYEVFVDVDGQGFEFLQRVGANTEYFDLGSRAFLLGTQTELFTIDETNNTLTLLVNDNEVTVTLDSGEDLTAIDIIQQLNNKVPNLAGRVQAGSIILGVRNPYPRDILNENPPPGASTNDICVQKGFCKINDRIRVVSGTALTTLGFTAGEEAVGVSYQNNVRHTFRIDIVNRDGTRTPFALSGPNFAQITPSKPLFLIDNINVTRLRDGYIYDPACGNPTDPICYDTPNFAFVIDYDVESPNRDIFEYRRLLGLSVDDIEGYILSTDIPIFDPNDIQEIIFTGDFENFDQLTQVGATITSSQALGTVIDLDENLQTVTLKETSTVGLQLPEFFDKSGLIDRNFTIPRRIPNAGPKARVEGVNITTQSSEDYIFYGVDPFVKVRNVNITSANVTGPPSVLSTQLDVAVEFEATSSEGVDSATIWWKGKKITLDNDLISSTLTLRGGSSDPNQFGFYRLVETHNVDSSTPRFANLASITGGSTSTVTLSQSAVQVTGQYDGEVLEINSGPSQGFKYKILTSTAPNTLAIDGDLSSISIGTEVILHSRDFGAFSSPQPSSTLLSSFNVKPEDPGNLIDINDGFILVLVTKSGSTIAYAADPTNQHLQFISLDGIRFAEEKNINQVFNINVGLQLIKANVNYTPWSNTTLTSRDWNSTAFVTSTNSNPNVDLRVFSRTEIGEEVLGKENIQL